MGKKIADGIGKIVIDIMAFGVVALMLLMLVHIIRESLPAFSVLGTEMFQRDTEWRPVSGNPQFGLLPAVFGTIYVSAIGVILALIFGIGCSLFINFYVPDGIAKVCLSFIELVAGIPSVIFGFIGLTVVVKWFALVWKMPAGQCVLAAGIVLGVMLLPFVIATCSESVEQAKRKYELAALSLGLSREEIMIHIIIPAICPGIVAAAMMALGRGLGETMAVMMVIGNSPISPKLLGRGQTIAALTALEMGSIEYGSMHLSVLYAANVVLLLLLFLASGSGYLLRRRIKRDEL